MALNAIESPILSLAKPFGASDVIAAVRILSTHDMTETRKPLSFAEGYHLQRMRWSVRQLKSEANKLLIYFAAQSLWPRFWEKETSSSDSGIPWELAVVACLVRNGHTSEEAWTMPEAEAIWLHIAHNRASGADISVVSDKEWEAMEAYKKSENERIAKEMASN